MSNAVDWPNANMGRNLLARGTGILAIKERLGHVFISTTVRYVHGSPARLQEESRMHVPSYL